MDAIAATRWAEDRLIDPVYVDCTTTVMLKILDGKCKMNGEDKAVIPLIYAVAKMRPGRLMGAEYHTLIEQAQAGMDEAMTMFVYEKRLLAETMISRPVMKAYKAWLREEGVLRARGAVEE